MGKEEGKEQRNTEPTQTEGKQETQGKSEGKIHTEKKRQREMPTYITQKQDTGPGQKGTKKKRLRKFGDESPVFPTFILYYRVI